MHRYLICLLALSGLPIAGCSHNTITYGDGLMLETTINPETFAFGVSLRYGKILTACVRENSELEMEGAGSGKGESGGTTGAESNSKVKFKIGNQITGYYVNAIEAGATPDDLKEYTKPEKEASTPQAQGQGAAPAPAETPPVQAAENKPAQPAPAAK